MNVFKSRLIPLVLGGLLTVSKSFGQCGSETIAVSKWCEGGFAKWDITDSDPNARYVWYNYVDPTTLKATDYSANGLLKNQMYLDSSTARTFYSPFRVTTAGIAPSTSVNYTYIKVSDYKVQPYPATTPTFNVSNTATGTYSMAFSTTQTTTINSVKIPVVLNTPGKQYKIQVAFGSTAGPGSAVYSFSTLSATLVDATKKLYLVEVPVKYTLTTTGAQTLVINTNPTGGSGASVDGLGYTTTQATATTYGPLTIGANSAFQSTSPVGYSVIYDWNISTTCPAKAAGASLKETNTALCCVAPASASTGLFSVATDKSMLPADGSKSATLTTGSGSASSYYAWYLNGTFIAAASGVGRTTYTTTQYGVYEVREVSSAGDKDNPSCFSRATVGIQKQEVFVSITKSPTNSPICIGDSYTVSGVGNKLSWSASSATLSDTTGTSVTFTGTQTGTATIYLKGQTTSGNLVVGGDFTGVANSSIITELSAATNPSGSNGSFSVTTDAATYGNSDWTLSGAVTSIPGNPGAFLMVNGNDNASAKPLVWGQKINSGVQAGNTYNFSFDFKSVSWIASEELDYTKISQGNMTAPYRDVVLQAYVNGALVGTASTNFAVNKYNAVKNWTNFSFPWKAPTGTSSATLEIRVVSPTATEPRGYDYGLDNIMFSGANQQIDQVVVGPFTDCSDITASASACAGDYRTLTAVVSGGMAFSHWESPLGTTIPNSTALTLQVAPLVPTDYYAVGVLPVGNLLANGDFEGGNTGFISGGQYFSYVSGTMPNGGTDQFIISNKTSAGNTFWHDLIPPAGGTQMFSADSKGPIGQKIIAWTFSATAGQDYLFSGYASNQHDDLNPTSANYANGTPSANLGVYITAGTPAGSDPVFTSLNLPRDIQWHQLKQTWTAPSTGTFTLYLADLNGTNGGGNDFVLDNFALQPLLSTATKKFKLTVENCACDPVDTLFASYCGKSGTFRVKDKYVNAGTYYGAYEWYKTAISTTPIAGTTVRNGAVIQFSTLLANATGPTLTTDSIYSVYLKDVTVQKPTIMPTLPTGCNTPTGNDQLEKYISKITVYSDVTLKSVTAFLKGYNVGSTTANLTINFYTTLPKNNPTPNITLSKSVTFNTPDPNGAFIPVDLPIGQLLSGSSAGTDYWIEIKAQNVNQSPLNCTATYPIKDNLGGTTVAITGTVSYGSIVPNTTGSFYNYQFEKAAKATCPRVLVQVYRKCPPCDKPAKVSLSAPKADTTVCEGVALTLKGSFVDGGNPIQYGALNYVWYKQSNVTTLKNTDYKAVPVGNYPFSPKIAVGDSGLWILRVEDGNFGNVDCYTEDTVHIKVDKPVIRGVLPTSVTICNGADPALIDGTAATGGRAGNTPSYQWYRKPKAGNTFGKVLGTSEDFDPTAAQVTDTTLFFRRDSSGVCSAVNTDTIRINVLKKLDAGTIDGDTTICLKTTVAAFKETLKPSGGGGSSSYAYQWWNGYTANGPFTQITGATAATFTPPDTLTKSTYYIRIVTTKIPITNQVCTADTSNSLLVAVLLKNNPGAIAKNDSTCYGVKPNALINVTTATGSTTPTYSWVYQTQGTNTWTTISGATNDTLKPSVLTQTTSYRRIAVTGNGTCNKDTTSAVKIKVYSLLDAGTVGKDTTVCSGNAPNVFKESLSASGGNGIYHYQWIVSATGLNTSWTNIPNDTNSIYSIAAQTVPTTTIVYLKRVVKSGNCPTDTNTVAIKYTVLAPVTPGKIGNDTSICVGMTPYKFSELTAAKGGDGTYIYKWKRAEKINNAYVFNDITAATNKNLYPTVSDTVDTKYVRIDSSATCAVKYTDTVTVKMKGGPNPGVISPDISACAGTTITQIKNISPASGGSGSPVYFWQKTTDGINWINLTGIASSNLAYSDGALLTDTTLYRRVVITGSGACDTSATVVAYNIYGQTVIGAIAKDTTMCAGVNAPAFKVTIKPSQGDGTYHYKWQQNENGGGWNVITAAGFSADSSTFDPGVLTQTTQYRRVVTSGNCSVVTENPVVVTITQNDTVKIKITDIGPKCINSPATFVATPTNEGTNPTYQWYVDNSPVGTNSPKYTTTTLVNGQKVKVLLTSSLQCTVSNTFMSNIVNALITDSITPLVTINQPDQSCVGLPVKITGTPNGGGVAPKYEWFVNSTSIGNNNALLNTTTLNNGDKVYAMLTADSTGLPCYTTVKAKSNEVKLLIYKVPTPNIIESDTNICEGSLVTYTVHNGGGSLQWYRDTTKLIGKIDSSITLTATGKYSVVESRKYCKSTSDTVVLKVILVPVANAGSDQYVLDGDQVVLNGSGGGLYAWTPPDSLSNPTLSNPKFLARNSITFVLTVSDSTQLCSTSDEVRIFVERPIIIVNTFTPNGDGVNDTWVIKNIESFPKCLVKIYNRWGNLVWESHSYANPWDGANMYNDQILTDGTYFYIIELNSTIFKNPYQGWVQIIK